MTPANKAAHPRLSLGPVQYHWPAQRLREFYREIETAPVDIVYLGETVCSKRRSLRLSDWMEIAERLREAGKEVVLSTLALVEASSELGYIRRLCSNGRFMVEANDMSAVQMLAGKVPFAGGASLNIYNPKTLRKLAGLGLRRWVMPVELAGNALSGFAREMPAGVETEVFAWGRLPLAYSARCYTARAHNVAKDACEFCCGGYPDGLLLQTREDNEFLLINGIQIQSARVHCVIDDLTAPCSADIFRINPQSANTPRIVTLFSKVLRGNICSRDAMAELDSLAAAELCNGFFHGMAGMETSDRIMVR